MHGEISNYAFAKAKYENISNKVQKKKNEVQSSQKRKFLSKKKNEA